MKVILLILIGMSSFIDAGSFSRANGVVSDSSTNLEWQDDYSDNSGNIKNVIWNDAIDYCEALILDGKNDWRAPNIIELMSLIDDSKNTPTINEVFQNTTVSFYWSSTTDSSNNTNAWNIYFANGYQYSNLKSNNYYVRCVR